jgi:hypothetical protein
MDRCVTDHARRVTPVAEGLGMKTILSVLGVVIFGLVLLRVLITVLGIVVGLALHARLITLEAMSHFVRILAVPTQLQRI